MPPQNQPQKQTQNPPINVQRPAASSPPVQSPVQTPTIAPAPYIPETAVPTAPQYKKSPDAGMVTITGDGALQFKLCYGKAGNVLAFVHHLRDHFIVDAWGIFRAAREHGFGDVLMLTRDGRITDQGDDCLLYTSPS